MQPPETPKTPETAPITISTRTIYKLAGEFGVDPRTLKRAINGETIRGLAGDRARAALDAHRQRITTSEAA